MERFSTWLSNLEALKAFVSETGHFPSKHTRLNNWCRYQRKRIKAGTLPVEQRRLFEEVAESRFKVESVGFRDNNKHKYINYHV